MNKRIALGCILLCSMTVLFASQPGQLVSDADLKSEPNPKSKTLVTLKEGQSVAIKERKGGWYAASDDATEGWVRMLHIRMVSDQTISSETNLGPILNARRGDATIATGIRGLSEQQLEKATENIAELNKLDRWLASDKDVAQFVKEGKLTAPKAKTKGGK